MKWKFACAVLSMLALSALSSPCVTGQQTTRNAEWCTNVYTDGGGNTTIRNNCSYQIHYYWIPLNDPNKHYNQYLDSGKSDTFQANGEFRWYACDAAYYVVGPDGRVINHLVDSYSCSKK